MNEGISVADALALRNNDDMFGGNGSGMWVFFLFILLAWGNGGWGNRNNAVLEGALTRADLCQETNFTQLANAVRSNANGICDLGYAGLNQTNQILTQLAENRFAQQQCCCETNRNIDAVRAENYKNTCEITTAIHAEGEATRALINANMVQELRDRLEQRDRDLLTANFQLSQQAQSANIISTLQPVSKPAYLTCSPYQSAQLGSCMANNVYNGCC